MTNQPTGQHTPGPWKAYELGNEDGTWTEWSICAGGPLAYGGDNTNGAKNSKANARLIAAAPELLAALQAVVDNGGDLGAREWEACKAAITAATK